MRTAIRKLSEAQIQESRDKQNSERTKLGEHLVQGLIRRPMFGRGLEEAYAKDPRRVTNLAFAIKNMEEHLSELTESQISSTLGTTPENVLRVLRLGYLNTCRQDCFWEMGLATAHDLFFYLKPKYKKTLRGALAGDTLYESQSYRSASDIGKWTSKEVPSGVVKTFTFDIPSDEIPLSPFTVRIFKGNALVANDNGKGIIAGSDVDETAITGTVNYTSGTVSVTFTTAPESAVEVDLEAGIALEKDEDLKYTQEIELQLDARPFTLREYPITASFSKKLELILGTSYKVDAEEVYLRAMADELRKTLDFQAFSLAAKQSRRNSAAHPITFNMQGAVGEAETNRIQVITRTIDKAGSAMYAKLMRGGVTKIFGGPLATGVLTGHNRWTDVGAQNPNGIYKMGMLGDIDVFRTPETVCPADEMVCVYKNNQLPEDTFIIIGTLIPLHVTDKLELANRQTQFGVASYGDIKVMSEHYAQTIKILNA